MKISFTILTIATLLSTSCEKDNSNLRSLEGSWIIKKMMMDPGNGTGKYQDVQGKNYITFVKDGSANSNYAVFGLHMLSSFEVIDSAKVVLSFKDVSSQPSYSCHYKFSGDTLILNPPCIEGCGLKLVRSK